MKKIMKIDIHVHTVTYRGGELPRLNGENYATPEQIKQKYDEWGIDKGIILPPVINDCGYTRSSSEDAYYISRNYPFLYWFCNVDPRMGNNSPKTDFSYFLNHYKALGAKGVGEMTANLPFDNPLMDNLLRHCSDCEMPVIFHIGPTIGECYGIHDKLGLPLLEKTLKKYPNLKLIGHSQPFWAEISSDVTDINRNGYPKGKVTPGRLTSLLREYENLYCDMSAGSGFNALSRDPEHAFGFIDEFQDKLMFGTDICAPSNFMGLSFWLDENTEKGNISEAAYKKVSRENAIRILKLEE